MIEQESEPVITSDRTVLSSDVETRQSQGASESHVNLDQGTDSGIRGGSAAAVPSRGRGRGRARPIASENRGQAGVSSGDRGWARRLNWFGE